ncbi:carbamoyl-phosphate synthase large subunit [Propioniciclava sp. MC1683]|uniref:carbamoyl-phosphate synthase large subunit n=1 Tax=Propioniciclava sp. MC1683 TaxID=2760309 RepID=UPI001602BF45|nr:carbamoyl-phosphate synthase large subunit [Propioniciclava sp. MC1683]MBB1500831.1 carbamoyl-phosphate synthase large subunit [Propioniciclava sp. MC1683]
MPKREDINKVLIIGSGPIVIGQACEFDYSGTQACKALRNLGYEVALVNSNPATIMTDPVMADETYIEPLNVPTLEAIIKQSKPDALLPNLGGQTGLNLSTALDRAGILEANDVQMIGITQDVIERGEDRETFKRTMAEIGVDMPRSQTVGTVEDALAFAAEVGYPMVVRPAYTMGGTGGGFVHSDDEMRTIAHRGLQASPITQVLVEESILGWEELEVEVIRDAKNQMISVCFIENVDAVGVHTGDSYCNAPMITIAQELQDELQRIAHKIVSEIGVIGGTNVQLAHNPKTGRVVVIEINPRTSRSSALASKATGLPIAMVSTLLAAGLTLDEIPYWRDGTLDQYTPDGDYVVAKFARWAFEKFPGAVDKLGTQMRAVGEVMSIGKDYKEAFGKAIRGLENGRLGLGNASDFRTLGRDELLRRLAQPSSDRQYLMYEALRAGVSVDELVELTHIKAWFVEQMAEILAVETEIEGYAGDLAGLPADLLRRAKEAGHGDAYLAQILGVPEADLRARRLAEGIVHRYEAVPVSGVEGAEYYFSTYAPERANPLPDPKPVSDKRKVMVLGGGPNRIGQGIEFDYCCVHAAYTLRDAGFETIMVNCNPETVSTDYDTSDKLYFEPLTVEDVLAIVEREKPEGVVCQFGGQTPLNIARALQEAGVPIIGTSPDTIDLAEDRDEFRAMMDRLGIPMPAAGMAVTTDEAVAVASEIGYPVIVRPSYVLGGRGMEIIHDVENLRRYMDAAEGVTPERPILVDRFLENALECEADAVCDGTDAFVPAVMEHIEYAGIHSGDSACLVPSVTIPDDQLATIEDYTRRIAIELGVVGLMNIQYAILDGVVYVLEANPRASRTVPLVSKVCDVNMASLATRLMLGESLASLNLEKRHVPYFGAKESVFPFNMFPEVDPLLGPEMRSTGEVLGLASNPGLAFFKSQEATQTVLPTEGTVLLSIAERDRIDSGQGSPGANVLTAARTFVANGFSLMGTTGTVAFLAEHGIEATLVNKLHEGSPHMADAIRDGQVQLVINTPAGRASEYDDSYIRKAAIRARVPYVTTTSEAYAAAIGIAAHRRGAEGVKSLQEWHASIG